jgi:two-component system, NtrC family, response regulator GlrR
MTARVLYVEDDDDLRSFLTVILRKDGYDVTAVSSAEDALEQLQTHRHQLLLTDYNLPNKNANWMLTLARNSGWLDGVPVVVLTASTDPIGVERYQVLRKPVDMAVLLATLDEAVLATASFAAAAPALPPPDGHLALRLYITGNSRESKKAIRNLRRALRQFDPALIRVEMQDVTAVDEASAAALEEDRVVVTPTLVRRHPLPKLWVFGDLSQSDAVEELIAAGLEMTSRGK